MKAILKHKLTTNKTKFWGRVHLKVRMEGRSDHLEPNKLLNAPDVAEKNKVFR